MIKEHLIFVPGLGDSNRLLVWAVNRFKKDGYTPCVHVAPWNNKDETLKPKLQRLVDKIDKVSKDGKVVLVGASAGASLVLNAYSERKDKVDRVANICGRLREGTGVFPSLNLAAKNDPFFKESVLLFEKTIEPKLTEEDRRKILTIRALADELVPKSTTPLDGATNITLPLLEHSVGIYCTLIFFRKTIVDFIKG